MPLEVNFPKVSFFPSNLEEYRCSTFQFPSNGVVALINRHSCPQAFSPPHLPSVSHLILQLPSSSSLSQSAFSFSPPLTRRWGRKSHLELRTETASTRRLRRFRLRIKPECLISHKVVFFFLSTNRRIRLHFWVLKTAEKNPEKAIPLFWAAINAGDRVDSAVKDMAILMRQLNRAAEAIEAIKSLRTLCSHQSQESLDNILLDLYMVPISSTLPILLLPLLFFLNF